MKRLVLVLLALMLCAGTALAGEQVYVGEKYTAPSGYVLTLLWPEDETPDRSLLEDVSAVYFTAYPAMRETYGTADSLEMTIYLADDGQMPQNVPAYTTESGIFCSRQYIEQRRSNLNCLVHEMFHAVQNGYPGMQGDALLTALCEGLADLARDQYGVMEETDWQLAAYAPGQSVTDGYTVTAAFLRWARDRYDGDLCLRLNRVLHEGRYTEEFWQDVTGVPLEALWEQYALP